MRKHQSLPLSATITNGGVGSILASMIRKIMRDLGIDSEERYESLMSRFIRRSEAYPDAKKRAMQRQGLASELKKSNITWKTFMRGFEFLHIKDFDFSVQLHYRDGSLSNHYVTSGVVDDKEAGCVLAKLFQVVMFERHIDNMVYAELMDVFIDRSRSTIHKRQRSAIRAAISKEILKNNITWKTFIKALLFIGVIKFTVTFHLRHQNRKPSTTHAIVIDIDDFDADVLEEQKDE